MRGGAEFFNELEKIIDEAEHSVQLQTYIYDTDETGTRITNALIRAAQRGVLVYMLIDGYASKNITNDIIEKLKKEGVHFSFFEPLLKSRFFYFGRRLHQKVIVADGKTCMVSGANISNRYNDIGDISAWLDWAVRVDGETAMEMHNFCIRIWNRSVLRKKCRIKPVNEAIDPPAEECLVRIRRNDWVFKRTEITATYREIFNTAESQVTLMTSYFWPQRRLLKRMAVAARRGVRVRLILTGRADVPFAKYTERYLYPWLFRHGIEVYEYQKNILHGKIATCDGKWLTVGSYNVNHISAFASVELNLDIKNAGVTAIVDKRFDQIMCDDCQCITPDSFKASSNTLRLFFYFLSYRIVHSLFFLFTFYFVQRKRRDQ